MILSVSHSRIPHATSTQVLPKVHELWFVNYDQEYIQEFQTKSSVEKHWYCVDICTCLWNIGIKFYPWTPHFL